MKLLILAPTQMELDCLDKSIDAKKIVSGVGIFETTYQTTKILLNEHFDFVIQIGVCGVYNRSFEIGDTMLVKHDCFGDIGVMVDNKLEDLFDLNLQEPNVFPFKNKLLTNNNELLKKSHLPSVTSVTVNLITNNEIHYNAIANKYFADIETLEGAAFQYVCLQQDIPFLQIRAVSNHVGERDKALWNISLALENLSLAVNQFIELLSPNY